MIGDVDAGAPLDLGVTVVERRAQQAREVLAHGGLAGAHRADEEDVALAEHGDGQHTESAKENGRPKAAVNLTPHMACGP